MFISNGRVPLAACPPVLQAMGSKLPVAHRAIQPRFSRATGAGEARPRYRECGPETQVTVLREDWSQ